MAAVETEHELAEAFCELFYGSGITFDRIYEKYEEVFDHYSSNSTQDPVLTRLCPPIHKDRDILPEQDALPEEDRTQLLELDAVFEYWNTWCPVYYRSQFGSISSP